MESAVNELEKTTKDLDNKLNNIKWKLEEFEKGVMSVVKNRCSTKMVSVMDLIKEIVSVRDDYESLRNEILHIEEVSRDVKSNLTDEMDTVQNEFDSLKRLLTASNIIR